MASIEAQMGLGNDNVTLNNIFINGNLFVEGDEGADVVTIASTAPVSTGGDLEVSAGDGDDQVLAASGRVYIVRQIIINCGNGNDRVLLDGASSRDDTNVRGGNDNDILDVRNHSVAEAATNLNFLVVAGGSGIDQAALRRSSAPGVDVSVDGGTPGGISVVFVDTVLAKSIDLIARTESAALTLIHSKCTLAEVFLGTGANSINVQANAIDGAPFDFFSQTTNPILRIIAEPPSATGLTNHLLVQWNLIVTATGTLEAHNDNLALIGNNFTTASTFNGGGGTNTRLEQQNTGVQPTFTNFS